MSGSNINDKATVHEDTMITSVVTSQCAYTWTIENFSKWQTTVKDPQASFPFPYDQNSKVKWILEFYPPSRANPEHYSLYLRLVSQTENLEKFEVDFELAMELPSGCILQKFVTKHDYGTLSRSKTWGFHKFIERKKVLDAIKPADKLVIKCKITTNSNTLNKKGFAKKLPVPNSLPSKMRSLVDGNKYGDVTILIGDQRFLAYKGILSAQSSVFAAMFEHEMQETIENHVIINDVDPDVFRELLRYIYTDQLTANLNGMAFKLYAAADKYDISTLKSLCRDHLMEKLNWKNAVETLILADMHSDLEMKNQTLRFLCGNRASKVTETDSWAKLTIIYPHLVTELFQALNDKLPGSGEE